ncbi:MAG: protein tyrosine phosphatase [Bryobacterales bacterium]|jgi:arsenate reductase|nr:protein tyrosine phosphatase [Bryobacterales bacterium]
MVPPNGKKGGIRGGRPRLRGESTLTPRAIQTAPPPHVRVENARKRVLFVCIGNSCRSQMAEAFARAYGSDILTAHSAGIAPASIVAPLTRRVLTEKNVGTEGQFPKAVDTFAGESFEVVVNLSGGRLPSAISGARVIEWDVRDPIGESENVYRAVAARIEGLVMRLILELRG